MDTSKGLSAACYLSVLCAPVIVPIVIFFIVDSAVVKKHAKVSLFSQLIPFLGIFILTGIVFTDLIQQDTFPVWLIIAFFSVALISFIVFIWNIIRGIKLLLNQ